MESAFTGNTKWFSPNESVIQYKPSAVVEAMTDEYVLIRSGLSNEERRGMQRMIRIAIMTESGMTGLTAARYLSEMTVEKSTIAGEVVS